jgi:hypothetical protein
MEKDIAKIKKNDNTDIVIRIDDYGGKRGITIREFTTSERYTGFTKSGTRIPAEKFADFKKAINSIKEDEMESADEEPVEEATEESVEEATEKKVKKSSKKIPEEDY